jgi:gluconolactonase
MDEEQNLVVAHAGLGSVWVFSRLGEPIFRIRSPDGILTTNVAYGGPGRKTLFITESHTGTVLRAALPVAGRRLYSHADDGSAERRGTA